MYTPEDISRLRLITTLRYLDFGIEEIRQVMAGEIQHTTALDWQIEALERGKSNCALFPIWSTYFSSHGFFARY